MKIPCILFIAAAFYSCGQPTYDKPHVLIETGYGDIELELYPDKAPITVSNFLKHVDAGLYNHAVFYRVVKPEDGGMVSFGVIQGGIFNLPEKSKQPGIPHESTGRSGLTHTDGILSMARTAPGTASTEFFICLGDQSSLDSGRRGSPDGLGYAAFGKVFSGMKTVRKIQDQPAEGDLFKIAIPINKVSRL